MLARGMVLAENLFWYDPSAPQASIYDHCENYEMSVSAAHAVLPEKPNLD